VCALEKKRLYLCLHHDKGEREHKKKKRSEEIQEKKTVK